MSDLIPRTVVTEIVGQRNRALAMMTEAVATIEAGRDAAHEAQRVAMEAHGTADFTLVDRRASDAYQAIFARFDAAESLATYRRYLDGRVWMNVLERTGMASLMDRTARDELYKGLCADVPEVTEANIWATLESLAGDAKLIFARGLARAFSDLDRRFRSHDVFKLGSRVILTRVFDDWGCWHYASRQLETLADLERVFAVLDGKPHHDVRTLEHAIRESRKNGGLRPRQSETETEYFRVRGYKNGNAHLWFVRDDLVEKANLVLAEYYGEVLPDARRADEPDVTSGSREVSKDLAFYPSPPDVVRALLSDVDVRGRVVLEPSAGDGAIARAVVAAGASVVHAIEVDHGRVGRLEQVPGVTVRAGNFLRVDPFVEVDVVIMNPPFYGTHWMEHVTRAYEWLAPGGVLRSVLPATAELAESRKHVAFRKWADERSDSWGSPFRSLPAESFSPSGTRINTVILTLRRPR